MFISVAKLQDNDTDEDLYVMYTKPVSYVIGKIDYTNWNVLSKENDNKLYAVPLTWLRKKVFVSDMKNIHFKIAIL